MSSNHRHLLLVKESTWKLKVTKILSFESTYIYLLPHRCLQKPSWNSNWIGRDRDRLLHTVCILYFAYYTGGVQLQDPNSRLPEKKVVEYWVVSIVCAQLYVRVACCMFPYVQFIHQDNRLRSVHRTAGGRVDLLRHPPPPPSVKPVAKRGSRLMSSVPTMLITRLDCLLEHSWDTY